MTQAPRTHQTLFASTEGRMLGAGLALTGLMLLAFGGGGICIRTAFFPAGIKGV